MQMTQNNPRKFLSAPGILFLIIVTQVPFVVAIYFSFRRWNLQNPSRKGFLGWDNLWDNYERILTNPIANFWPVLQNTIVLTLSVVVLTFIFGMMLALLLNRPFPGRAIARTLLISPFLVMPVAAGVLWKNILLNPTIGIAPLIFDFLRIPNVYIPEAFPMGSIILIVTWQWTPFVMLILLSGLQSLPDSTVEAAKIDGAGGIGMFRFIILPHLQRFIEIALLLETIFILNVFGIIFIVTSGGPSINTTNLPYHIYLEAFSRFNIGRASAYGIFAVILANIIIILFLRVLGKQNQTEVAA